MTINNNNNTTIGPLTTVDYSKAVGTVTNGGYIAAGSIGSGYSNGGYMTVEAQTPKQSITHIGGSIVIHQPLKLSPEAEPLEDRLSRMEAVMGLATRNAILENKYPELKQAGDDMDAVILDPIYLGKPLNRYVDLCTAYRTLTAECKIMEKLKLNNDPA